MPKYVQKCLGGGKETLSKYLRKQGMKVGERTKTASQLKTAEPYLITIGDDVTISHGVDFITHDNSVCKLFGSACDLYGEVKIGNQCFIGAHAVIMYGVTLADKVIVAAGSVVTKSVSQSEVIVAGNPAKIIGTWKEYRDKTATKVICTRGLGIAEKKILVLDNDDKWVRRKTL